MLYLILDAWGRALISCLANSVRTYHHHEKVWGFQSYFKRRGEVRLFHVNSHLQTSREKRSGRKFPYICHKSTTVHHKKVVSSSNGEKTSTSLGTKKHIPMTTSLGKKKLLKSEPDFFGAWTVTFPKQNMLDISTLGPQKLEVDPILTSTSRATSSHEDLSATQRLNKNDGWTPAQQLIGRQLPTLPNWNPDFLIFDQLRLFHPFPPFFHGSIFLHVSAAIKRVLPKTSQLHTLQ